MTEEVQALAEVDSAPTTDVTGANPFAQGYKYLKTLPSFATAIDN
jgi:hypothetical protein